jgi:hypothetical protein
VRRQFDNVTRNWYHRPQVGEYIELTEDEKPVMIGRVISVGWVEGPNGEFVLVRVK